MLGGFLLSKGAFIFFNFRFQTVLFLIHYFINTNIPFFEV